MKQRKDGTNIIEKSDVKVMMKDRHIRENEEEKENYIIEEIENEKNPIKRALLKKLIPNNGNALYSGTHTGKMGELLRSDKRIVLKEGTPKEILKQFGESFTQ